MVQHASGKHAFGICDRTGFRYPLKDLVYEYKNGKKTGLRVGRDVADPDHPQNSLGKVRVFDPQSLDDPRPDVEPGRNLYSWNPVGHDGIYMVASVGKVTVTIS